MHTQRSDESSSTAPGIPHPRRARLRRAANGLAGVLALGLGAALVPAGAVQAAPTGSHAAASHLATADNPYERGPDPTEESIEAPRGAYDVATQTVSSWSVSDFGGGTIYYPTETGDGTFGAMAIAPGFTADQSSISWYGPRLASRGFVVFTIDTLSRWDQPDSRGRQLLAALDYLTGESDVRDRIDATRLGVLGHSMGGGGSLEAAADRPSLEAAIPLTGWNTDKDWSELRVPTMIIGADGDGVAPVSDHSEPFYESLSGSLDRAYLELNGANHYTPNSPDTTIAKYSISWLKRFIDDDTRYEQFLCPIPSPDADIEEYRGNCPHGS